MTSSSAPKPPGRRLALLLVIALFALGGLLASDGPTALLLRLNMRSERGAANLIEQDLVVDGVRLKVLRRVGAPGAPTALLLHGFGGDKDNWTRFAKWVPLTWGLLIPDLAGFGESERRIDVHHDIESQAERLHKLMVSQSTGPVIVAGNSMGGQIASALTLLHPGDVSSLVLIDAAGVTAPERSEVQKSIAAGRNPLVVVNVADFDRLMGLMFVTQPEVPGPMKDYFASRAARFRLFNEHIFAEIGKRPFPLDDRLGEIRAPTLVIWGDSDQVLHPSGAKVFADGIAHAKLAMMPRAGHAPMLEYPEQCATLVKDFVAAAEEASTLRH